MTGRREEGAGRRSPSGSRRGDAAKGGAAGPWVAAPLYAASLTTGGAFGILFAGGSRNPDAGFLAEAGGGTWLPLVVAALVAALAAAPNTLGANPSDTAHIQEIFMPVPPLKRLTRARHKPARSMAPR